MNKGLWALGFGSSSPFTVAQFARVLGLNLPATTSTSLGLSTTPPSARRSWWPDPGEKAVRRSFIADAERRFVAIVKQSWIDVAPG